MKRILRGRLPSDLRGRLNLLVFVSLVPMIVVQAVIFGYWYRVRRDTEFMNNLVVARMFASSFQRYVEDMVVGQGEVAEALLLSPPERRDSVLSSRVELYPVIASFSWINPAGRIINSSLPKAHGVSVADRLYFQMIRQGRDWVLSDVLLTKVNRDRRVVLAVAIRDSERNLVGALLAELALERIGSVLGPGREEGGIITLWDGQSRLVAVMPPSELQRRPQLLATPDDLSRRCLETGKEITGVFELPGDPNARLAARVPLQKLGWVTGASRPLSEVTSPVKRNLILVLVPVLIVGSIALALARHMAGSLAGSVLSLREGAVALAAGKEGQVEVPDIDELKDLAETFNRMSAQLTRHTASLESTAAELTRSNSELEAFTYTVSHDLRAPLRAIDGFATAIQEDYRDKLDDEGRRFLGIISQNTQRMGQLIDDLLAYSRLGRRQLSQQTINMQELVTQVAAELAQGGQANLGALDVNPMPVAKGDPTLVRQIVSNLLSNAFKFTSGRENPRIEVGGREDTAENVYWVRDNGVGFDMRYQNKLFGIFQRLHSTQEFPGTGVGLAIVSRIVQKHGGRVWAEGQVGEGAAFFFTLPRKGRTA